MEKNISETVQKEVTQYNHAVSVIKCAILKSQARAAQMIVHEQLALYYGIGRYVSQNSRNGFWGKGAIATISKQLRYELPGLKGFGETMNKRMRTFYEEWKIIEPNSVLLTTDLNTEEIQTLQFVPLDEFPLTAFLNISFSHHILILRYAKTLEERMYYIQQTYDQRWKVDDLEDMLKANVYQHRDNLPNNFFKTIPDRRLALKTLQMLKDEYMLNFINVEDIDEIDPECVDESVVENQIVMNIKNFIMTFGKYFVYKGHQVHYDKLGHDHRIDLLFFNRQIKSMVVVELKKGSFKSAYLGQLRAYLRVLDDEEKLPDENPSVGIILCKKADKAYVEYVLQDYLKPMGVATYQNNLAKLKELLPPEEDLKNLIHTSEDETEK